MNLYVMKKTNPHKERTKPMNIKTLLNLNKTSCLPLWCYFFFLIFIAGFFFSNTSKQLNNIFYISLCLPALIISIRDRKNIFSREPFFILFFALALWILLTAIISSEQTNDTLKELKPLVYVFFLSVIIFYISQTRENFPLILSYVILISASTSGVLLLFDFYEPRNWNFARRLLGHGSLSNSIWVGAAYGFAAIISINLFLQGKRVTHQLAALSLGAIPFVTLLATQSRGPLLAFATALIFSLIAHRNKLALLLTIVGLACSAFLFFQYDELIDQTRLLKAGDSYRIAIWNNAIDEISKAPFIGHGISADSENYFENRTFNHYHNVYLTLAFHTGIIGLLLFLPLMLYPLFLVKNHDSRLLKSMLIFGMAYMFFNASRLFTSPKEIWLIFWVPLLFLWAHNRYCKAHE